MCAACWQKSCYNLFGSVNECAICKVPTELVCFRDYWKFIGKNILNNKCWIQFSNKVDLDKLTMFCSVEGCLYSDTRPNVIKHEKECWGDYRRKHTYNRRPSTDPNSCSTPKVSRNT